MKLNRKLVLLGAFLATLAGIAGCLKAGDGAGLTEEGKVHPCILDPKSTACTTYTCRNEDSNTTIPMCKAKLAISFALKIYPLFEDKSTKGCVICHSGVGIGVPFLDLSSSTTAYNNLVGKLVWGQSLDIRAPAPGWFRVKRGQPDSSMLYLKLNAGLRGMETRVQFDSTNFPRGYGDPMPSKGTVWSVESIELVRKWIKEGANP